MWNYYNYICNLNKYRILVSIRFFLELPFQKCFCQNYTGIYLNYICNCNNSTCLLKNYHDNWIRRFSITSTGTRRGWSDFWICSWKTGNHHEIVSTSDSDEFCHKIVRNQLQKKKCLSIATQSLTFDGLKIFAEWLWLSIKLAKCL